MKSKLVALYREKEIYTLFYDSEQNKIYRFPHRNKSSSAYFGMFFLLFYGLRIFNDVYQLYRSPLLNIALFVVAVIICYFFAEIFLKNYYIQRTDNDVYFDEERLEYFVGEGMKQFRLELTLGLGVGIPMVLFGFVLFFIFSQIDLLIIGALGLVPLFILFLMRPYTRNKILKNFESKKIKL